MIRLRDIIKEILSDEQTLKKAYSWQRPDGSFRPVVEYDHAESAEKITGQKTIDAVMNLWKKGWQRIRYSYNKKALFCHNEFIPPNDKQKEELINLAMEGDFGELIYEGENIKGTVIWSKENTLQEIR